MLLAEDGIIIGELSVSALCLVESKLVLIAYFTLTATTPALYILRSCEAATDRRPRSRDQAEAGDSGDHTD